MFCISPTVVAYFILPTFEHRVIIHFIGNNLQLDFEDCNNSSDPNQEGEPDLPVETVTGAEALNTGDVADPLSGTVAASHSLESSWWVMSYVLITTEYRKRKPRTTNS